MGAILLNGYTDNYLCALCVSAVKGFYRKDAENGEKNQV
jgi:hypothetical protein